MLSYLSPIKMDIATTSASLITLSPLTSPTPSLPASQAFSSTMTSQIPPSAKSLLEDFGFRNEKDKLALYQRTKSFINDKAHPQRATMSLKQPPGLFDSEFKDYLQNVYEPFRQKDLMGTNQRLPAISASTLAK